MYRHSVLLSERIANVVGLCPLAAVDCAVLEVVSHVVVDALTAAGLGLPPRFINIALRRLCLRRLRHDWRQKRYNANAEAKRALALVERAIKDTHIGSSALRYM
jgi:hypothetical protein